MTPYNILQWLFFFYWYSFLGWCFESTYVSLKNKRFVNRGFMRGPLLPLYGSGALMMLAVSMPFRNSLLLTYLAGCVGATALEYVTGVVMEALFKVRYWDYSDKKWNFQGHICLGSTLAWGLLTIFMTHLIHRPVDELAAAMPPLLLFFIVMALMVVGVTDFTLSFKAAMDVRDMLVKLENVREELERLQRRLDVVIALADEAWETRKQEGSQKAEELVCGIEERLEWLKERVPGLHNIYPESIREEIADLKLRFGIQKEQRTLLKNFKDMHRRHLLLGNPGMVSLKFRETMEELKEAAWKQRNKKK